MEYWKRVSGPASIAGPAQVCSARENLLLGSVSGAAALAFARVLAFASVVAGRAAAVTFARVLAFTSMLVGLLSVGFLPGVAGCR